MVKLRLTRLGGTHEPFYRIIAIDSKQARDAKYIEAIGYYDPAKKPADVKIDSERAKYWIGVGAQPSETVRSLLKKYSDVKIADRVIRKAKPKTEAPKADAAKTEKKA